jgi:CheY-like chemotaxis protein/signal transduction histidine kinase
MRGKNHVFDLCQNALSETASYAGAHVGAIFLSDGDGSEPVLKLASGYAYSNATNFPDRFRLGEGLVGQVAAEKKQLVVKEVPKDYVKVCSGLGDACPDCITITPLIFDENVIGVLELGFIRPPSELQMSYLEQIIPSISVNLETVKGREGLAKALAHSQALHEELQQQQEELRAANEELEEQTEELKTSQDKLRLQQEEMEAINKELQEKNQHLDQQKKAIEQTNLELEQSQQEIAEKAEKLAQANKYKSDFLANVSHELRTPLNSMLLLSRMLSSNVEANLTDEQVRSAEIIHSSGKDLLSLINDILDLSKIEAGRMNISFEDVPAIELGSAILNQFKPLADDKGLGLSIAMEAGCPEVIRTDRKRLDQILRNLVSNAIKFTEKGIININFRHALREDTYGREELLAIAVADTGVGIPPDKHALVFEAFQQLEGGETRKYGGTGLGLSISRELAHLLGGQIHLDSEQGIGSTFTLILPVQAKAPAVPVVPETASQRIEHLERTPACASPSQDARAVEDDRADIGPDDKTILIVEDDLNFAELLIKLCREKGFKCLAAMNGDEGVTMAAHYSPKGIILDLRLPGKDGWTVLSDLKDKPGTRHIPVYIMSIDDAGMEAFRKGAIGFLTKPANEEDISDALHRLEDVFSRPVKKLLIIEDDRNLSESIRILIGSGDVHVDQEATAKAAIEAIRSKAYDCMILDLGLPDMNGLEMLEKLSAETELVIPPVIVYTGRELTPEEEMELRRYSDSIIVKGVKSEERLLDEACLFLHCIVEKMPARKRQIITDLHSSDTIFKDKQVLIVDDDMRNVFALSSALEARGMKTIKAENGKRALDILDANPEIDLILLDIMMPVMDGYETMQHIRAHEKYGKVPILALTAKAMKQDRERCIASGASDYLSKPVDLDRLFSMMRVWLYR